MHAADSSPAAEQREDALLRQILQGTAAETGAGFFSALVRSLCEALGRHGVWVTEYLRSERRLRALAFWLGDRFVEHYEYALAGTPCEPVIDRASLVHVPDEVVRLYPRDPDLRAAGAVSYLGVPLLDVDGTVLGHLAVLDTQPMPERPRDLAVIRIFAARAAAELQRLRAEDAVRERERELSGVFEGAFDGIVELDERLRVTRLNRAARELLDAVNAGVEERPFSLFLRPESAAKLEALAGELGARRGERAVLWIPGGLEAVTESGARSPVEASLSRLERRGRTSFVLIVRSVNERIEAERRIDALRAQAEYLRDEVRALGRYDAILGRSPALLRVLREIDEVAPTGASVLVFGETGTGKELVARAIHAASARRDGPMVRVNCAALPASLVESELFGHARGAFTGAIAARAGRFSLADGGTIFLDEIGEFPLELQSKLLRVLQEGELEPLGSARTQKVDVRVVAATNRDLGAEVRKGRFREDLFYRLDVFPIRLPPLRERPEDVPLLAQAFADRFARRMGRTLEPLSGECLRRLQAYAWPGNVRELQNVMERAVITARDGRVDLARALPDAPDSRGGRRPAGAPLTDDQEVRTADEMLALERENIRRALDASGWRVAGERGAARLLGLTPSTLSSRMRSLGILRPHRA